MLKTALIDADIICYRIGFACPEGEPVEFALHSVKQTIHSALGKLGVQDYRSYLSGSSNFRYHLATLKPYKGTRSERKPEHYEAIREYLVDVHGATITDGIEADDALGIEQYSHPDKSTCIVSIDKDLDTIPGYHYNWVKDIYYDVSLEDANYNFYTQMLVGDVSDNIPGIRGIGPKTAHKLLNPHKEDMRKVDDIVREKYREFYGDSEYEKAFDEVASLLWILRTPSTTWKEHVPYRKK